MSNNSLSIFRSNPDLADRLLKQINEVKKSKNSLLQSAETYNSGKYANEVQEGTKKLQLLLEDGKRKGLSEAEILGQQGSFCPSVRTPILNLLYFLMREYPDVNNVNILREEKHQDKDDTELLNELNKAFGSDWHQDDEFDKSTEKAPSMDSFIYGNLTNRQYLTIKKLKRLSQDQSNINESVAAYKACLLLCKKYGLEFSKVKV